jgi:hypothetical protein
VAWFSNRTASAAPAPPSPDTPAKRSDKGHLSLRPRRWRAATRAQTPPP